MHRFNPENMKKLDREERKAMFNTNEIWQYAGLQPGMTAADIGCGTGFFTFDASFIVGNEGIVYALDIQEPMIEELKRRIKEKTVQNITPVVTAEDSLILQKEAVDIAFMAFVLHEVVGKLEFLKETYRIIKQGGKLCILEWKKTITTNGPSLRERISEGEASELLESAGFSEIIFNNYNIDTYLILGKK